jgi:hypothetical protein
VRELIEFAAYKPHIPVFLALLLYVWIAAGSYMINEKPLAGMWVSYAQANAFMFWYYLVK